MRARGLTQYRGVAGQRNVTGEIPAIDHGKIGVEQRRIRRHCILDIAITAGADRLQQVTVFTLAQAAHPKGTESGQRQRIGYRCGLFSFVMLLIVVMIVRQALQFGQQLGRWQSANAGFERRRHQRVAVERMVMPEGVGRFVQQHGEQVDLAFGLTARFSFPFVGVTGG